MEETGRKEEADGGMRRTDQNIKKYLIAYIYMSISCRPGQAYGT